MRLGGRSSGYVSGKREWRRGGDAVGGRFCIGSLVPSLCVPEGAKNRNIAKTISPRPLFSGRGLVRTESGCVQTSLEFSSWKLAYKYYQVSNDIVCNLTYI